MAFVITFFVVVGLVWLFGENKNFKQNLRNTVAWLAFLAFIPFAVEACIEMKIAMHWIFTMIGMVSIVFFKMMFRRPAQEQPAATQPVFKSVPDHPVNMDDRPEPYFLD